MWQICLPPGLLQSQGIRLPTSSKNLLPSWCQLPCARGFAKHSNDCISCCWKSWSTCPTSRVAELQLSQLQQSCKVSLLMDNFSAERITGQFQSLLQGLSTVSVPVLKPCRRLRNCPVHTRLSCEAVAEQELLQAAIMRMDVTPSLQWPHGNW